MSFQKALNPKKTFSLFDLFEFELRGFGFWPSSPKFGGSPAMNISGQIKLAQIGDVMKPSIDFHGLWIAPPRSGQSLPRIKLDGLGVDIGLSGTARIRGTVLAVDPQTQTVEGMELAPKGSSRRRASSAKANSPSKAGARCRHRWASSKSRAGKNPDEQKKSFFLFLQAEQIAVEIPVGRVDLLHARGRVRLRLSLHAARHRGGGASDLDRAARQDARRGIEEPGRPVALLGLDARPRR